MANVPLPPIAPRTALWGLGFKFELIAQRFDKLRNDIQDIWLIGTWLSYPFYAIGYYMFQARDLVWQADDTLVEVITWIKGITEGNVIIGILEHLWYEFRYLKADPIGWVSAKIDQVSGELRHLRLDPLGWIRTRFRVAMPEFTSLLNNGAYWVYSRLIEWKPEFGDFIRNTHGYIRDKVLSLFGWARELETNPAQMIINRISGYAGWFMTFLQDPAGFIYRELTAYNWELRLLLTDPTQWVKEKIGSILGISTADMDNFVPFLIKRMFSLILSNHQGLLDYTKEALINLVLRYI